MRSLWLGSVMVLCVAGSAAAAGFAAPAYRSSAKVNTLDLEHTLSKEVCVDMWQAYSGLAVDIAERQVQADRDTELLHGVYSPGEDMTERLRAEHNGIVSDSTELSSWYLSYASVLAQCSGNGWIAPFDVNREYQVNAERTNKSIKLADAIPLVSTPTNDAEEEPPGIALGRALIWLGEHSEASTGDASNEDDGDEGDPSSQILQDTIDGLNRNSEAWGDLCIGDDDRPHCN